MGPSKPTTVRMGAVLALLLVAVLLVWALRGTALRQRPSARRASEQGSGGRVTDSTADVAEITPGEQRFLLGLARDSLDQVVRHGRLPPVPSAGVPDWMRKPSGCFVTLEKAGQLRGCIGHIQPQEPLVEAVIHNARSAALRDPRFARVTVEELDQIEVEVSVLTVPRPLSFDSPDDLVAKLRPHEDGVVLSVGARHATFLPQVWEKLPEKEVFLQHLSNKAGLGPTGWTSPQAQVSTYQVRAFKESDHPEHRSSPNQPPPTREQ